MKSNLPVFFFYGSYCLCPKKYLSTPRLWRHSSVVSSKASILVTITCTLSLNLFFYSGCISSSDNFLLEQADGRQCTDSFEVWQMWVQILALILTSSVTLAKLIDLSMCKFFHLYRGDNTSCLSYKEVMIIKWIIVW